MLFLDIETKNKWEVGESFKVEDLRISYVGVIDEEGKEYDFWEDDIDKLGEFLKTTDKVVHYNGFSFDMPVLANYLGHSVQDLAQIDLMVAAHKTIGFRPKLDDLANATLGRGKIGKGSDAVMYWDTGQLEKLREYCLMDVQVTKELYYYGIKHGIIKYYDRNGFIREMNIDWTLGEKLAKPEEAEDVLELF